MSEKQFRFGAAFSSMDKGWVIYDNLEQAMVTIEDMGGGRMVKTYKTQNVAEAQAARLNAKDYRNNL